MTDPVNHPPHYTAHPSGVECIQITEHMGFCLGNAVKYLWRADLKGDAIEDLRKARWYIDREIARREAAARPAPEAVPIAIRATMPISRTVRRELKSGRYAEFTVGPNWTGHRPDWPWAASYGKGVGQAIALGPSEDEALDRLVAYLGDLP